jgi:hypothetical protein
MDAVDPFPAAFIYTMPLYEMARVRHASVGNSGDPKSGRVNRLGHRRMLSDHLARRVTTPNNDTLYSSAWLDLEGGPLTFRVPQIRDRYWSIQFLDIYTNTVSIVGGGRSEFPEDRDEHTLWIAHEKDPTPPPAGHHIVRLPSRDTWMLVRIEVRSEADLSAVHAIQDAMILSAPTTNRTPLSEAVAVRGAARALDGAEYVSAVNNILRRNGVPATEQLMVDSWKPLGVGGSNGNIDGSVLLQWTQRLPELYASLERPDQANQKMVRGWTLPDPAVGEFGTNYLLRARIAHQGLGALPSREAQYFVAKADAEGRSLDASYRYRVTIPAAGYQTRAFWSLSLYQVEHDGKLFFTDNPLRRYSLGSSAEGVVLNADGSLDITVQRNMPADASQRANWLPSPGPGHTQFQMVFRIYLPKLSPIENQEVLPSIRRLD